MSLLDILQNTLVSDKTVRENAELALANLTNRVQSSFELLQSDAPLHVKAAAAVYLKKTVREKWILANKVTLPAEEQTYYMSNIVELISSLVLETTVRNVLIDGFTKVVKAKAIVNDEWPQVLSQTKTLLNSDEPKYYLTGLVILEVLLDTSSMDVKDDDIVKEYYFDLLKVTKKLPAYNEESSIIHTAALDCISTLLQSDLTGISNAVYKELMQYVCLFLENPSDNTDRSKQDIHTAIRIIRFDLVKYINAKEDSEWRTHEIAEQLLVLLLKFIETEVSKGTNSKDNGVYFVLEIINRTLESGPLFTKVLQQSLPFLLSKVIYPAMCYSPLDVIVWEDDPADAIRIAREEEYQFDPYQSFFKSIGRYHEESMILLEKFLIEKLNECAAVSKEERISSMGILNGADAQKDGILKVMINLMDYLSKTRPADIQPMLEKFVVEEFDSQSPFLRSRALTVVSAALLEIEEGEQYLDNSFLAKLFLCVANRLEDSSSPVACQSAVTLDYFFKLVQDEEGALQYSELRSIMAANHTTVMTALFKVADLEGMSDNSNILSTIGTLVVAFRSEIVPYAVPAVQTLVNRVNQLCENTIFPNNLEDTTYFENVFSIKNGCEAIGYILSAVHAAEGKPKYAEVEAIILPLLRTMLSSGGDCVEDGLLLASRIPAISPGVWELVPLVDNVVVSEVCFDAATGHFFSSLAAKDPITFFSGSCKTISTGKDVSYLGLVVGYVNTLAVCSVEAEALADFCDPLMHNGFYIMDALCVIIEMAVGAPLTPALESFLSFCTNYSLTIAQYIEDKVKSLQSTSSTGEGFSLSMVDDSVGITSSFCLRMWGCLILTQPEVFFKAIPDVTVVFAFIQAIMERKTVYGIDCPRKLFLGICKVLRDGSVADPSSMIHKVTHSHTDLLQAIAAQSMQIYGSNCTKDVEKWNDDDADFDDEDTYFEYETIEVQYTLGVVASIKELEVAQACLAENLFGKHQETVSKVVQQHAESISKAWEIRVEI